ncbi:MAG: hypothetical protein II966_03005 [Lachnospiraceae bacterium]|nr:hypothetical protein [Lachnospiraceae bacterium]
MKKERDHGDIRGHHGRLAALLLALVLATLQVQEATVFAASESSSNCAMAEYAADEASAGNEGTDGELTGAAIEEAVSDDASREGLTDNDVSDEKASAGDKTEAAASGMSFKDGMAQEIYEDLAVPEDEGGMPVFKNYKNSLSGNVQRFTVYVETDLDTDMDGKADLVMASVQVPTDAVNGVYKAPAIFEASPYFGGTTDEIAKDTESSVFRDYARPGEQGSGKLFEYDHDYSFTEDMLYKEGTKRTPSGNVISTIDHANRKDYDCDDWYYNFSRYYGQPDAGPWFIGALSDYDYFLSRGFAVVLSPGLGTRGSEGLETCGSRAEAEAFAAVVEWINGKRRAFTDKENNIEIKADWASGKIAMEGLSYDGSLAYEVAALEPEGLVTVVPECGIASWYDYTNMQGVCHDYSNEVEGSENNGSQYDYTSHLASTNSSVFYEMLIDKFINKKDIDESSHICRLYKLYEKVLGAFCRDQYTLKGHYGYHWKSRDFYTDYKGKIKIPALIVAGLQDYNVMNKHAQLMSEACTENRILLHLGTHVKPEDMSIETSEGTYRCYKEILNLWFSHFLCGQENGILEELPPVLAQDNTDGEFKRYNSWNEIGSTNWGDKKLEIKPSDALEHRIVSGNEAKNDESREIMDPETGDPVTSTEDSHYYDIDDYYEELDISYVSPLEAGDPAGGTGDRLLTWSKYADSDMTINGSGEIHIKVKTDRVSDENFTQPVLGAMLYDISNDYFDAYELNGDNALDNIILQSNAYYWGKAAGSHDQVSYVTSRVKKHLITKGCVNLLDPHSGYYPSTSTISEDRIEAGKYYDYTVYLNPTFYTVKAGHSLVLYIYPKADSVPSNSDFTVNNAESFAYIPLNSVPQKGSVSFDSVFTEDKYGDTTLSGNIILPDEKRTVVSTVTTENYTLYSKTNSNLMVQIEKAWMDGDRLGYVYQGEAASFDPDTIHVYDGIRLLSNGDDYTIAYKNNKKATDKAELIIKFTGSYKGNKQISYPVSILKADLGEKTHVEADNVVAAATGKALKPVPEMVYASTGVVIPASQVKITYSSKTDKSIVSVNSVKDAGDYTINIEPKSANGNLTGMAFADLTVTGSADEGKLLSKASAEFKDHKNKKYVYENKEIIPELSVTLAGVNDGKELTKGVHYSVKGYQNKEPGKARLVISAIPGNELGIMGSKTVTFTITKGREFTDNKGSGFYFAADDAPYSQSGTKGKVTVKDGETWLVEGVDYTVSYSNNKAVPENNEQAVAAIKGKGKYKGSVKAEFTVLPMDINRLNITVSDKFGNTEKGYENPTVTVTDLEGKKLKPNRDYKAEKPEKDSGNAYTVIITGEGNYTGTFEGKYRYLDKQYDLSKVKNEKIPDQLITGDEARLPYTVLGKLLYTGTSKTKEPLTINEDYEISYYLNNTKTGTAKVVLKGIGKYAGTKTLSFKVTDGKKRDFLGWLIDGILRK